MPRLTPSPRAGFRCQGRLGGRAVGDFTPATSGGTASNAGVDDLVKELQDAGARLAAEVKAETQK